MPSRHSPQLKAFFERVTSDTLLQDRLYKTKELSDVEDIGRELGFNISSAEIIKAQAHRILASPEKELDLLAAGKKPHTVAQWGRGGSGFLERAGFWLTQLLCTGNTVDPLNAALSKFLNVLKKDSELQKKIKTKHTFNALINKTAVLGYKFSLYALIRYQATVITQLPDAIASQVASGDLSL